LTPIRTVAALVGAVVLAGALAGCRADDRDRAGGDIVIGADLALSGPGAVVGTAYQRALELKVEQVNASGVLGDRRVRLLPRDNRSEPGESTVHIGQFADAATVAAVVTGGCDDCVTGLANTANDRRVPVVALSGVEAVASPVAERRYVFRLGPDTAATVAALVAGLREQKVAAVGLLATDDSYGVEGLQALTAELGRAGVRLVRTASVGVNDTDLTRPVAELLAARPAALVLWAPPAQAMAAAVSAKQSGFTGRLVFGSPAAGELFLPADAARAAEAATMVFTATMVTDEVIATSPAKAARTRWFREYTARYGGYHAYSSFAADAVQLVVDAVLAAGAGADRDAVRDRLENARLDGLSGPVRMSPADHSGLEPQALRTLVVRDGRWQLAG
jgi:branched-chain amino acid transport system substrate-binding protein